MTKHDLAVQLSARLNYSKSPSECLVLINTLVDIVSEAFLSGSASELSVRNFGSLQVVRRQPKKARDINAGRTISIPARRSVRFVVSPVFRSKLNGK